MKFEEQIDALKHLSPQAFLALGTGHVAYVRPVTINNQKVFSLHAADGTALTLVDTLEGACALAQQNDLDAVTVQ
ncbi:MAG TPA: DUF1150 family protein [Alphaproteobacteria bacterium]|nr:DUF1150 family protein [Alphaproteobacteria bacterium]HOO50770.1 DUF1150 family protein [Alphaproteobacteria bacterium]